MQHENPVNPLPMVVWLLALPMVALELVFALGQIGLIGDPAAIGWRVQAMERFAFFPQILQAMWEAGDWPLVQLMRMITYVFVQGSVTQAVFVVAILLALGKMVGEVFHPAAVLAVFVLSAVVGAIVYTCVPGVRVPLIGGFPAVYGLIGAFTFLLWVKLAGSGAQYRAFSLIGLLLAVQLLFAALFGTGFSWVADLAGFVTGFALSFVVSPGGPQRMLARIRQR
ncbi:rhomboid family intramembrane serine protease [Falsirhodobacter halotolerans]|uniref:rhomboid family intramembrane serine protease n=1 Tax=Falsirhodobacter halotolerans TaxID=1146892 RepID=UPI001FD3FF32|nr:rhomboid family intramembrane serine protease [Falsirhodobacter halotolerans]MCJ8138681.1 rhomboid family intramembrane serine protease [Falsirhodobacter halotolerans]